MSITILINQKSHPMFITSIQRFLLVLLLLGSSAQSFCQEALTTAQWQEDLSQLENSIHTQYSHLFDKITKEEWDAKAADLRTALPHLEEHEIKVGFTKLVSAFEYGHTQVPFSTLTDDGVLAVTLYHFEDGIFVEGVQKGDEKALGAKVLKIAGMPIDKALEAIRAVVPAENDYYFKGYGLRFLTVPSVLHAQGITSSLPKDVKFTLEKEGSTFTHTFKAITLEEMSRDYLFATPNDTWVSARNQEITPLYLKELHDWLYRFEYLEDSKTLYVRQSSVFNDEKEGLQDFYVRLFAFMDAHPVEKLIYDVRLNGGGNNYNNKNLIKGLMARPNINQKGHFFYIIGRNTYSACQNLTNEIQNYTEAIIVGEPTAENLNFWGDSRPVTLGNSGIKAYLSYAWWQDMSQWDNKEFTIPHLASTMTFEQYANNQDPALEIAMNLSLIHI